MATSKEKQNLRFKITSQRINKKVRYDGFTKEEINLIKAKGKADQFDKELSQFWSKAPRNSNGVVNWDAMTESELDYFEYIFKQNEMAINKMSKLEENGVDVDKTLNMFMMLNTGSVSF